MRKLFSLYLLVVLTVDLYLYRKENDYQRALREQIEENRRRKEEDKRKEEDIKRREYEEYMRSRGLPVEPPSGGGNNKGKRPQFRDVDQDSYDSRDEDYGGSDVRNRKNVAGGPAANGAKRKGIPGLDFDPQQDQDDDGYNNLPPKKNIRQQQGGLGASRRNNERDEVEDEDSYNNGGRGGRGGRRGVPPLAPRRGGAAAAGDDDDDDEDAPRGGRRRMPPAGGGMPPPRRGSSYDDDYDSEDPRGGGGKRRGAAAKGGDEYISAEQYDELSKLCDKLLAQQEVLQGEIEQQASLIKVCVYD